MIHVYPTRAEWLAAREGRVGASEVFYLLQQPAKFLQRRAVPLEDNDDLWRGRMIEPYIGLCYGRQTGQEAQHPGLLLAGSLDALVVETHDAAPWASYSPDFYVGGLDGPGIVETKSQRRRQGWADEDTEVTSVDALAEGTAPVHMIFQCYWQLLISGRAWVDLTALLPNYELRIVRVHRDEEFQSDLLAAVAEARDRYIIRSEIPPPSASRAYAAELGRRFPQEGKTVRRATNAEDALIGRYARAKAEAEAAKDAADLLKHQILAAVGADYGLRGPSGKVTAPTVARETFALSECPDDVRAMLEARGLIGRGATYRQVRLS